MPSSSTDAADRTEAPACKDERRRQHERALVLIRVLFLTLFASMGAIQPFLPVYYRSLGHSGLVIGILGAIRPLVTLLVSPVWGVLADRQRELHFVLEIALVGWVTTQLLLMLGDSAEYLVCIALLTSVFYAPIRSLTDSVALAQLSKGDQYGRVRLFGQLGFGIGTSVVGVLMSHATDSNQDKEPLDPAGNVFAATVERPISATASLRDLILQFWHNIDLSGYRIAFCTFAFLSILSLLCVQALGHVSQGRRDTKKKETPRIMDGLLLLTQDSDKVLFFFLVFVVGLSNGCTESFCYVRMQEAGATWRDIGIGRLLGSMAGSTMFWFAQGLTQRLGGPVRVLLLTPLTYATRFFIYAAMKKPHHTFPAEILRGVSFGAFWTTAATFAHEISPPGMNTTMLMFLHAVHGGLGPSIGAIVFGKLQSVYGTADSFAYLGVFNVCFVALVVLYRGIRDYSSEPARPASVAKKPQHEKTS